MAKQEITCDDILRELKLIEKIKNYLKNIIKKFAVIKICKK